MISEVQRIQNRSGLSSTQMARMLGVSVRMLVSWKTGDSASKTAEHRLRLLGRAVDSYGDQPPERIRYLLFAPKNGVSDYDWILGVGGSRPRSDSVHTGRIGGPSSTRLARAAGWVEDGPGGRGDGRDQTTGIHRLRRGDQPVPR